MRDISLHILDLIENAIRAGATTLVLAFEENPSQDELRVTLEDDGSGLPVAPEVALDPFYTTKEGHRVGLGLSLFRGAAERAEGSLVLGKSKLGGLAIQATMRLSHVDRSPTGDLAATLSSVVCTNPELDLRCHLRNGDRQRTVRTSEIVRTLPAAERFGLNLAREVYERLRSELTAVELTT